MFSPMVRYNRGSAGTDMRRAISMAARQAANSVARQFGGAMASRAMRYATEYATSGTQTTGGGGGSGGVISRGGKRLYSRTSGRLAGFVGSRRKRTSRPRTRRGRRMQRRRNKKFARKVLANAGVEFNTENIGIITDNNAVYVGHGSFAPQKLTQYVCYALVKMIINYAGVQFNNWDLPIGDAIPINGIIAMGFRPTMIAAGTDFSVAVAAADTYRLLAEKFWNAFYGQVNTGLLSEKSVVEYLLINKDPVAGQQNVEKLEMNHVVIDFFSKDSLKLQNRSVALAGDLESTDVDNVPLSGKLYFSGGNYFESKNELAGEAFVANRITNLFALGAGASTYLREPPQPYYFKNTIAKPVRFNPGQIKTNVLRLKKSFTLPKFIEWCKLFWFNQAAQSDDYNRLKTGQVCMFGLEKVIGTGSDTQPINVKYEVDQHLWINVRVLEMKYTTQIVE